MDNFNPATHVSEKPRGEYVTRLSLKANDAQPRIGVYFLNPTHALLSMFHSSTQNWLIVKNLDPNTAFDIHLDTFYLTRTVKTKYEMPNSQFQRLILAGADLQALETAAHADCQVLGYDSLTITYPVHFDLQFLRDQQELPVNFEDLDGFLHGTMFCQPETVLVHVESFKVNMPKFLQAIRDSLAYQMRNWGASAYYESRKESIIRSHIGYDIHRINIIDPFLERTFITRPEALREQEKYAIIPPTPNVNPFTDLQYPIPRDVIRSIALNLSLQDILQNCLTSKTFNAAICDDESFWREKVRADYPQREATKRPDVSWKAFYQGVVGRDGLLGVKTGYTALQLIGILGFLSNVVLMPPDARPFNLLRGYYDEMIARMSGLNVVFPMFHNMTATTIWSRATGEELSKFWIKHTVEPERQHFKPDEPDKYTPLTQLGIFLSGFVYILLEYVEELIGRLRMFPWILNLTKDQIDDYLEAFLVSPGDDFTVQLKLLLDYKGDPVRWRHIFEDRVELGLMLSIKDDDEIEGENTLYTEYRGRQKVYDGWSTSMIIELIGKKLRLTRNRL